MLVMHILRGPTYRLPGYIIWHGPLTLLEELVFLLPIVNPIGQDKPNQVHSANSVWQGQELSAATSILLNSHTPIWS